MLVYDQINQNNTYNFITIENPISETLFLHDNFYYHKLYILDFFNLKEDNLVLPTNDSIKNSLELLDILEQKRIEPNKVSPSPDGGIMFEFLIKNNYYLIEIYNDGDCVFLKREPNGLRKAFDFNFEELKRKIINSFYD